jgi:hypothetical protein
MDDKLLHPEVQKIRRTQSSSSVDSLGFSWPSKGAQIRANETQEDETKRIARIASHVTEILKELGEDPSRQGILKTPERYAKALLFLTRGYQQSLPGIINEAIFEENHDEMVIVRDIEVNSLCEHHLVPIIGKNILTKERYRLVIFPTRVLWVCLNWQGLVICSPRDCKFKKDSQNRLLLH